MRCATSSAGIRAPKRLRSPRFPVLPENPYQLDLSRMPELLERSRPQLVILGKSMIINREPVAEIRGMIDSLGLNTVIMYDMAHVLGLVGPHFQEPFKEGADLVTGSTHKTFFGTQRGIVAADMSDDVALRRAMGSGGATDFPGAVSNHHLGTLIGLLFAAYEMNAFRDSFQVQVLANAKALAEGHGKKGWGWPAIRPSATRRRTRLSWRSATRRA